MNTILNSSIELITALKNKEQKNIVLRKWNNLADIINSYDNYNSIPNIPEVSEAIYLFARNYTNKNQEEECIRCLIVFCLLYRASDETIGKDKIESLIRLILFLNIKLKYLVCALYYTLPRQMSDNNPLHLPHLDDGKKALVQKNHDAIKVYVWNSIINDDNKDDIDENLSKGFESYYKSVFENLSKSYSNILDLVDGKELLSNSYRRFIEYGKYPIYIYKEEADIFYKRSRGLIEGNFKFYAKTYVLIDTHNHYNEGTTESTFIVKMEENQLEIMTVGIKEEFIKPFLSQKISHVVVEKMDYRMEIQLEHKISLGDGDNVPTSLDIIKENGRIVELRFFFVVGKEGFGRYIKFYGESCLLTDNNSQNERLGVQLLNDFNFNLDNIISYKINDKYLPVRAMTADNMGILGDVAIIGCNPIIHNIHNNINYGTYEIIEYEDTEYFVFSKWKPLYNLLVSKVLNMDPWIPDTYQYKTIKGWVFGALRIVHIDNSII